MKKTIVILFLLPILLKAQSAIEVGDLYFDLFQFKEAIKSYETALYNERTTQNEGHLLHHLAYSHLYTFQYQKAAKYFGQLVVLADPKQLPDIYLDYGNVLKIIGDYDKAREQYKYYISLMRADEYTDMLQKSLAWAVKHQDSIDHKIKITPTNLNIGGQSLGYEWYDNGLIYAHPKDTNYSEFTSLFDLKYAVLTSETTFQTTEQYVSQIKFAFNEGSPSITADGETLYFTATASKIKKGSVKKIGATQINEEGISTLKIYQCKYLNGEFGYITELPFNNKQYNYTHPCISDDGNTLYFASDKPGGFGGFDLYLSKKNDVGVWGEPINLGSKVNTTENELFPFESKTKLYFASKGHVGFGGYDLFVCEQKTALNFTTAHNLGKPINTSHDDVAFLLKGNERTGYLSSNRDSENGVDVVYYVELPEVVEAPKPIIVAIGDTIPKDKVPQSQQLVLQTETIKQVKEAEEVKVAKPQEKPAINLTFNPNQTIATIYFGFDKQFFSKQFYPVIDSALWKLKVMQGQGIAIHAHTDCRGKMAYNKSLSAKRGNVVRAYLLKRGYPKNKVVVFAHGETKPIVATKSCRSLTPTQHRLNRRVELKVIN